MMPATPAAAVADFWCDRDDDAGFPGRVERRAVGALMLSRVSGTDYAVHRSTPLPAHAGGEVFLLALQRRGSCALEQPGRALSLAEGDMTLYPAAQPFRLAFSGPFEQIVVRLAAAPLRALCPQIDGLVGTAPGASVPQVRLLASMADCYLATDYAAQPAPAALHAADALRLALAGCALATPVAAADPRRALSLYHLDRIRKFALARLGDSELSIAHLVDALGISAAHIHRLFAGEAQTFSAWLWDTRLMFCHLALRNPSLARLSIGQIAYKFGYSHPAHFSRAYRLRFGMTPSAWRHG